MTVASDSADDAILLALDAVDGTLSVALRLGGLDLGLTGSVLLLAGLGPGVGACHVADGLDNGTLDGVVLAGGLTVEERVSLWL